MSLPFYDIECTTCSYKGKYSFNVWYEFESGRDAVCQPHLTQGWCEDCERILTIYAPQTNETIKRDIDMLSEWIADEKQKRTNRKFIFFKQKADEEAIERWSNKIKALKECVNFFQNQRLPMRCLTCGSKSVSLVRLSSEYGEFTNVGVKHHCGGDIMATMSGRIAYGNLPKVIYDIQGNILHDER